jgi:Holliday junction resolvasome RuvABC ATP-dependent DNA helicase subunit
MSAVLSAVLVEAEKESSAGPSTWWQLIGQRPLKRYLEVHMNAAIAMGTPLPHTLLASGHPGVGKTTISRLIAQTMGGKVVEIVPPFNVDALVKKAKTLDDGDFLFIDEIHKLSDGGKKGSEILLKLLEDGKIPLRDGSMYSCKDFTVIGATTDADKLPETVIDRFKLKPTFQPYTKLDLANIVYRFAERHDCISAINGKMCVAIAMACRGVPRIAEEMVLGARALYYHLGRPPSPRELFDFTETRPDGLTRQHVNYLLVLYRKYRRKMPDGTVEYIAGLSSLGQLLRESPGGIDRLERYLIEVGFVERTTHGRKLTRMGISEVCKIEQEK